MGLPRVVYLQEVPMKIRKYLLAALALTVIFGAMAIASSDASAVPTRPQPASSAQLIESRTAYDRWGNQIGTSHLAIYQLTYGTRYSGTKICIAEFYLKNLYGSKVISFKLIQSFSYEADKITRLDAPITTISTKWGWQQSSLDKGSRNYTWSARSWVSAKFDLKFAWFVVQTYRPYIYLNLYGGGTCYAHGYW